MTRFRDLTQDETGLARALLERMGPEDRIHHFQRAMIARDFDLWEERARRHCLIGGFVDNRLVGLAEIAQSGNRAECSLWVEPAHRLKGVGTALFEHACAAARDRGALTLMILVTRGDPEMLDMAVRHDGLSVYRHGQSMILPEGDHGMARWLAFDLAAPAPESWFGQAVRSVREALGLSKSEQ